VIVLALNDLDIACLSFCRRGKEPCRKGKEVSENNDLHSDFLQSGAYSPLSGGQGEQMEITPFA
jgi:hypothetical protein